MTNDAAPGGRPISPNDPHLDKFHGGSCDRGMLKDAIELMRGDPSYQRALAQISGAQPHDLAIDFDHNGNRMQWRGEEVRAASSYEWAVALIAAARVGRAMGVNSISEVPVEKISKAGQAIFDDLDHNLKQKICAAPTTVRDGRS